MLLHSEQQRHSGPGAHTPPEDTRGENTPLCSPQRRKWREDVSAPFTPISRFPVSFYESPEVEGQLGKEEASTDRGGGRGNLGRCTRFVSSTLHTLRYSGPRMPSLVSALPLQWGDHHPLREQRHVDPFPGRGRGESSQRQGPLPGGQLGSPGRLKQEGCETGSFGAAVAGPDAVIDIHPLLPPPPLLNPLHSLLAPCRFSTAQGVGCF